MLMVKKIIAILIQADNYSVHHIEKRLYQLSRKTLLIQNTGMKVHLHTNICINTRIQMLWNQNNGHHGKCNVILLISVISS